MNTITRLNRERTTPLNGIAPVQDRSPVAEAGA